MQRFYTETCRRILPFLEKTLEMRNGGNQFFMGEQVSISTDIRVYREKGYHLILVDEMTNKIRVCLDYQIVLIRFGRPFL